MVTAYFSNAKDVKEDEVMLGCGQTAERKMKPEASARPEPRRSPRKHPRVRLVTQAEATSLGHTENISEGGMLMVTRDTFEPDTEVMFRFNLPSGRSIHGKGVVIHAKRKVHMGIRFLELKESDRRVIAEFVHEVKPYRRRSARVPRRLKVVLRWVDPEGNLHEEPAETVLVSRYGGLMVSAMDFKPGDSFIFWWPERHRGAHAQILFSRVSETGGLIELGFKFLDVDDFWETEFPGDTAS